MQTVIFDLDGTLADTSGDLIAAANATFEHMGLGPLLDPQADKLTAFHGARAMLRLGFSRIEGGGEDDVEAGYPFLLDHYAANINNLTVLYPGARDTVEALLGQGYKVGICTNKPVEMADDLMRRLDMRDLFAGFVGAGTLSVSKPDPAPYRLAVEQSGGAVEQSLIVGDTATDAKTARAVGVPAVLVGFGPEGDEVGRHGADAVIPDFPALPDTVARLIGRP
ncbi:HAD-IA family hydrolase [Alphaproteobacteria bacterium GH1-50]|uniref:phosphoglycolate phosphatase n=1 Tax=Kangsaoukella pontilimi TaxID=2691042 RepID=A0A7C9MDP3_9RHOB|nr:HAD-IA family hydrolase [Kangsaoukella pontilimi]MXQ07792.1 HAD-IA family hydrolase [Kangsaoukella pontilimi]